MFSLRDIVKFSAFACLLLALATTSVFAEPVTGGRVTIRCAIHEVAVTSVSFNVNGVPAYQSSLPLGCSSGAGDSRLYDYGSPLEITDFECDYTSDGGSPTHVVIPQGVFYQHFPMVLPSPSPGGVYTVQHSDPFGPDDAYMVISDHDVMMIGQSECFQFTGGPYDYVCVTWYCEYTLPPIFTITPGCSDPCGNPNCPPAQYMDIAYSQPCNPVPNIWCRLFWPIGLTSPGCWCYHFEDQLDVELASFTATPIADGVNLSFATASETDNHHFEIWRGTSQYGEFENITTIASHGDAATRQEYNYTDSGLIEGRTYWYYLASVDNQNQRVEYRDRILSATPTGAAMPTEFSLSAYPNPFNPATTLEFAVPSAGRFSIRIYDLAGRLVTTLADNQFSEGTHHLAFDASKLTSGIYMAQMTGADVNLTSKLLLIK